MFIVHVAGHLGKDPETRFTANGQKVSTFSLAVNQRKGKEEMTVWVRVTIWGDRFDKMLSFIKKGSGLIVSGKLNPPTTYVDKEGRTQVSLEMVAEMIEFSPFGKNDRSDAPGSSQGQYSSSASSSNEQGHGYGAQGFTAGGAQKPAKSSAYGGFSSGQGESHDLDEDSLPF